jgi:hypothetical protein
MSTRNTTRKMIYGNTPDFKWYRLVTVADTQNNWHGTSTCHTKGIGSDGRHQRPVTSRHYKLFFSSAGISNAVHILLLD